jgi:hypothetical protein
MAEMSDYLHKVDLREDVPDERTQVAKPGHVGHWQLTGKRVGYPTCQCRLRSHPQQGKYEAFLVWPVHHLNPAVWFCPPLDIVNTNCNGRNRNQG